MSTGTLLMCALTRNGEPCTAATVYDNAIAICQGENWPRAFWPTSVMQTASYLKGMEKLGTIKRIEAESKQPFWEPTAGFDTQAEIPDLPEIAMGSAREPLTSEQHLSLFDCFTDMMNVNMRIRRDTASAVYNLVKIIENGQADWDRALRGARERLVEAGVKIEERKPT